MNTSSNEMSIFAQTIMLQKYSKLKIDGSMETWPEIAYRVAKNVLTAVSASQEQIDATAKLIAQRKFIPGGRYLYASGMPFHQVQNCVLNRADDSREGWADHLHKAAMALMTGAGLGVGYSLVREKGAVIKRTGGTASGPIPLMLMTNECGRGFQQGGSRRSAIWAGLNWKHPDIFEFIALKDWSPEVRALKAKDFNFPAPMDMTNISVGLDDEFFEAYNRNSHPKHSWAQEVYWETTRRMLETAEPGFSVDTGENAGEDLRNAPVCGSTNILTIGGYQPVEKLIDRPITVWTGSQWATDVVFKKTNDAANIVRVSMTGGREIRCDETHPFFVERYKGKGARRKFTDVDKVAAGMLQPGDVLHVSLPETLNVTQRDVYGYTLGYVYGDGSFTDAGGAEITFCTDESKLCADEVRDHCLLSSINENDSRGFKRAYFSVDPSWKGRSKDVFPEETGQVGPVYAASFLAGLFDADGNWEPTQKRIRLASKHEGFLRGVARLLEQNGILASVSKSGFSTYGKAQTYQLVVMSEYNQKFADFVPTVRLKPELEGYTAYRASQIKVLSVEEDGVEAVYCADVKVPEHSFQAEGVIISNCTEVTSRDDSDICNLGSINMAQIESLEEMQEVVTLGTQFLLAGTVYSDLPYDKIGEVREKNRRLGLGLMGLHEWLLKKGLRYEPNAELAKYLGIYATSTDIAAVYADALGVSRPVKTRAIAPTGTIGIMAETSGGIEPIFCVAYKRRYLKGDTWMYQYVLDPVAKRLIDAGVPWDSIEDAYTLAENPERRIAFQAWLQGYVDHAISSTLNLPEWGTPQNNAEGVKGFGDMLMTYLPKLRGITCYPDGARGGQPLTRVKYPTAMKHVDQIFVEAMDVCDLTKGSTCGS